MKEILPKEQNKIQKFHVQLKFSFLLFAFDNFHNLELMNKINRIFLLFTGFP